MISAALEYAAEISRHHGVALEDTNDIDQIIRRCAEFGLSNVDACGFMLEAQISALDAERQHSQAFLTSPAPENYPAYIPPLIQLATPAGYRLGLTWRSGHPGARHVFTLTVTGKDE